MLGELLALPVEIHERLVGRDGAERVGELALDELADGVLVEVALAEGAGRRHHVLLDRLDLDEELGGHVRADLVARDQRVAGRALDRELDRSERDVEQLVEDGINDDAAADHHFVAARAGADERLVRAAAPVEAREGHGDGGEQDDDDDDRQQDDLNFRFLDERHGFSCG